MQIVLDEMQKDFETKFVAFAYEDICKDLFADLCKQGTIDFVPSRIGAYWLNDYTGDTEIDVMAVDNQNKRIFAGECKYIEPGRCFGILCTERESPGCGRNPKIISGL